MLNLFRILTFPIAFIWDMFGVIRNILFDIGLFKTRVLPGRVISIGNLELGGSGKTPLVLKIAEELINRGYRPAILTRGYMSGLSRKDLTVYLHGEQLTDFKLSYAISADEALYLSHRLPTVPVIVGRHRYANALRYWTLDYKITHWILDDGYQHRQIHREEDVVIVDSKILSWIDSYVFPVGEMRENILALRRATKIIIRADVDSQIENIKKRLKSLGCEAKVFVGAFKQSEPKRLTDYVSNRNHETLSLNKNRDHLLFCAVANNHRVLQELRSKGISVKKSIFGRDHKKFNLSDFNKYLEDGFLLITTAKDYYRQSEEFERFKDSLYLVETIVNIKNFDLFFETTN